jgi:hypothetical protein
LNIITACYDPLFRLSPLMRGRSRKNVFPFQNLQWQTNGTYRLISKALLWNIVEDGRSEEESSTIMAKDIRIIDIKLNAENTQEAAEEIFSRSIHHPHHIPHLRLKALKD